MQFCLDTSYLKYTNDVNVILHDPLAFPLIVKDIIDKQEATKESIEILEEFIKNNEDVTLLLFGKRPFEIQKRLKTYFDGEKQKPLHRYYINIRNGRKEYKNKLIVDINLQISNRQNVVNANNHFANSLIKNDNNIKSFLMSPVENNSVLNKESINISDKIKEFIDSQKIITLSREEVMSQKGTFFCHINEKELLEVEISNFNNILPIEHKVRTIHLKEKENRDFYIDNIEMDYDNFIPANIYLYGYNNFYKLNISFLEDKCNKKTQNMDRFSFDIHFKKNTDIPIISHIDLKDSAVTSFPLITTSENRYILSGLLKKVPEKMSELIESMNIIDKNEIDDEMFMLISINIEVDKKLKNQAKKIKKYHDRILYSFEKNRDNPKIFIQDLHNILNIN